jgi:flagellar hook assembly protein FlgD
LIFFLGQNRPNPFHGRTAIDFALTRPGPVDLRVFDVSGRVTKTLVDRDLAAGKHGIEWRGESDRGTPVAPGVYFYRLVTPGFTQTRKMLLMP